MNAKQVRRHMHRHFIRTIGRMRNLYHACEKSGLKHYTSVRKFAAREAKASAVRWFIGLEEVFEWI